MGTFQKIYRLKSTTRMLLQVTITNKLEKLGSLFWLKSSMTVKNEEAS